MTIAVAPTHSARKVAPPPVRKVRDRATDYARAVVAGEVVVGELVRIACQRHLDDLEHGHERGLVWDPEEAEWSIDFFLVLRHFEGPKAGNISAGIPAEPVVLEPWQCFGVGVPFGWKRFDEASGRLLRRFTKVFKEVAKKNGKTLEAGGIGLRCAFFDGEPGAKVYAAATKRDQAKLVWGAGAKMRDASPDLVGRIGRRASSLFNDTTNSFFQPLSKETKGEDGINPYAILLDELHRVEDRDFFELLSNSFGAREQGLLWIITTGGTVGESIWAEEHDYAVKVLKGLLEDDSLFALIYNLDEGDDPFDEAVWPKANPNLGVSVRLEDMRQQAREAREKPGSLNGFLRLRLNIRTQSEKAWMPHSLWQSGKTDPAPMGRRLSYGGLDLGSRHDLAAFVAVAEDGDALDVFARFWLPTDAIPDRVKKDRVPYDAWVRQGWITATPGDVTDYDWIRNDLNELVIGEPDGLDIYDVGYDQHDATQLSTQLTADGFRLIRIMQSTAEMDSPVKEVERLLATGAIRHGGNPVLAWMVDNVVMIEDASLRRRPDKAKAKERIDGVVALLMAIKRWMANAGGEGEWTSA